MTERRTLLIAALSTAVVVGAWFLFRGVPQWLRRPAAQRPPVAITAPVVPGRKIKARLFYVSEDGSQLTGVERDVAYGEGPSEQAKEIVKAQIEPAAQPLVSAVPSGTRLRALFVTPAGDAYVDLSSDLRSAHPGGSLAELLTVYTFVQALTTNLPAVKAVQILVEGKEVDSLAGHVNLRGPLAANEQWVAQ